MVKRLLQCITAELGGLHQAALLLGLSSLASQLLGLLRDHLLARSFGAAAELDIYYTAFLIPDMIFVCIGSFLAVTVLIPVIVDRREHSTPEDIREFLGSMLTFFLVTMLVVNVLVFIFMPTLVGLIAPGFTPDKKDIVVGLTRILLWSPFFLGLSNLFGSVTQSFKRFGLYAISPLLYNLGIISGVTVFYPIFGTKGLVYGVILGAVCHFALQVPVVVKEGLLPRLQLGIRWAELKYVVERSLPRTLALGANQFADIVLSSLASTMALGSIAIYNLSFNLQSVPMSLIGISYSVAAFPTMSHLYAKGDTTAFARFTNQALRHILFWSLPVAALFIVLRAQIVRVILGSGAFNWNNTRLAAASLGIYAFAVVFQSLVQLLDRAYYATGHTKKPVVVKLFSSALIICFAFLLPLLLHRSPTLSHLFTSFFRVNDIQGTDVLLLPVAFTLGMLANVAILWSLFTRDLVYKGDRTLQETLFRSGAGAIVIGVVSYFSLNAMSSLFDQHTLLGVLAQGGIAGLLGLIVGVLFLYALKSEELQEIIAALRRKTRTTVPIQPGPDEAQ